MAIIVETWTDAQKWTSREHFRNPLIAGMERGRFAMRVHDYAKLCALAFSRSKFSEGVIALDGTDVTGADFPVLTRFVADMEKELEGDGKKFSLAVIASSGLDASLCLAGLRDGKFYGGLFVTERDGRIDFGTRIISEAQARHALQDVRQRLHAEVYSGNFWEKEAKTLRAADKLFKYIVSRTIEEVRDRFSQGNRTFPA